MKLNEKHTKITDGRRPQQVQQRKWDRKKGEKTYIQQTNQPPPQRNLYIIDNTHSKNRCGTQPAECPTQKKNRMCE